MEREGVGQKHRQLYQGKDWVGERRGKCTGKVVLTISMFDESLAFSFSTVKI
jgi:hypothetical protein